MTASAGSRDGRSAETELVQLHVVLVHPEIHWNTGNTGRSCLAAGAQLHLVEPIGFSLHSREVARAGLDYWSRVKPRVWSDWNALESRLPELGQPFFFTPAVGRCFWDVAFPRPATLVFGSESAGFPADLCRRYAARMVAVPMSDPQLRSINVSTCVGVALFEVLRQWRGES